MAKRRDMFAIISEKKGRVYSVDGPPYRTLRAAQNRLARCINERNFKYYGECRIVELIEKELEPWEL